VFIQSGKTKSRSLEAPSFQLTGKVRTPANPPQQWAVEAVLKAQLGGTQITESDGNRWPLPKGDDKHDYGSEFYSKKQEVLNQKFNFSTFYYKPFAGHGSGEHQVSGPHIANCFKTYNSGNNIGILKKPLQYDFPPDLSSSRESLVQKGTVAISLCQPTNQIANAATFVGELMQDVPAIPGVHLWESRLRAAEIAARASGEFLNLVFGILPTIGDMDAFLKGVHKIDKAVDQLIRDSGRMVRRQFHFPTETTTTTDDITAGTGDGGVIISPAGVNYFTDAGGRHGNEVSPNIVGIGIPAWNTTRVRVVERKAWFSGAFTYHLPDGYDSHSGVDRAKLMARLYGAKPDIDTLWQLTPWSWAVDWFSNTGHFLKNLQAHRNYGSVLRYGYMMETTTITDSFIAGTPRTTVRNWVDFPDPQPTPSTVHLRTTVKKRIKANPFGFGISWEGLSPLQLAIAAALGISRVAR